MKMLHAPLFFLFLAAACAEIPIEEPVPLGEGESPFKFPLELWDQGLQGSPLVAVHVTEAGTVDSAYVVQTSGYDAFDEAAVTGAQELRFIPARRGDRKIDRWIHVPVRFVRPDASSPGGPPGAGPQL